MPNNHALLTVQSEGGVRVSEVSKFLEAMEDAYNSLYALDRLLVETRAWREPFSPYPWWPVGFPLTLRRGRVVTVSPTTLASLVSGRDRLVLAQAQLGSPGFWTFLGTLIPFETIRKYLVDRHERRKDRDYREAAEAERLKWENEIRKNEVLRGRIENLKELGATEKDLAPLLNDLLYRPLEGLNQFQDRGMILDVEVKRLEAKSE